MIEYICPKCGHVMQCICLTSYPPQTRYKCFSCGYVSKTVSEQLERCPLPNELQPESAYVSSISTDAYVNSISTDTGVNFYDLIEPGDPDTD